MPHIHDLYDFTASAFILHPSEPKILLLKHIKIGKWLQPGGHIELNETPLQALHHELEEETGLKPTDYELIEPAEQPQSKHTNTTVPLPFHINYHHITYTHQHIDMDYLVRAKTERLTSHPDGASAIGWFNIEEIRKLCAKGDLYKDTLIVCEWLIEHKF